MGGKMEEKKGWMHEYRSSKGNSGVSRAIRPPKSLAVNRDFGFVGFCCI